MMHALSRIGLDKFVMLWQDKVSRLRPECQTTRFSKFSKALLWRRCLFMALLVCAIVAPMENEQERRDAVLRWVFLRSHAGIVSHGDLDAEFGSMSIGSRENIVIFNPAIHEDSVFLLPRTHQFRDWDLLGRICDFPLRSDRGKKYFWLSHVPLFGKVETVRQSMNPLLKMQAGVTYDSARWSRTGILPTWHYTPEQNGAIWMYSRARIDTVLKHESALCAHKRTFCMRPLFADSLKLTAANLEHSQGCPPQRGCEPSNGDTGEGNKGVAVAIRDVQGTSGVKSNPDIDEDRQEVVFAKLVVTAILLPIVYALIKRGRNNVRPPQPRKKRD